jgi:two-component system LytT family sensor kinase
VVKPFDKLLRNTDNFIHRQHNNWPGARQNNLIPPQGANAQPGGPQPGHPPDSGRPGPPPDGSHIPPGGDHHGPPNGVRQPGTHLHTPPAAFVDSNSLFIFLMIMAISTAIRAVQQWQLTEQRAARAEADKASAELSFLKAQINPHFLFNTLNNIYTLAVTSDTHAADSIMKLSNIMRYVTDDVTADFVPLQSEIDCISDYIELQRLRMNADTPINFTVQGNTETKKIPPLVLMTFVENVFKYGISKQEPSPITIDITVNNEGISFFCQNRIFVRNPETQRAGIGIKNTKQRLEHLYPGRHLLYITNDDELYIVQLNLQN